MASDQRMQGRIGFWRIGIALLVGYFVVYPIYFRSFEMMERFCSF